MSFVEFAQAHGVVIEHLITGDRVRRCPTVTHPRKKNASYFFDGRRGWVRCWDGQGTTEWWNDPNAKPWSDAEKREWAAKRAQQERERQQRQRQAVQRAADMLREATPGIHGYLISKGLPDEMCLRMEDGSLIVPMRDHENNALRGAQVIRWLPDEAKWEKKMLFGMRAEGAVLRLGQPTAAETWLCEGFATGVSIHMALRRMRLNASVLVCFSDSNMVHVAASMTGRRYVFADNDVSGAGERAAQDTGLPYCMAPAVGMDANDLHVAQGLTAVCALVMQARSGL
jgi:putative DNA primase/helicase